MPSGSAEPLERLASSEPPQLVDVCAERGVLACAFERDPRERLHGVAGRSALFAARRQHCESLAERSCEPLGVITDHREA